MLQPITKSILTPNTKILGKGLIYHVPKTSCYKLIDIKKKFVVGEMHAFTEENRIKNLYNIMPEEKVFKILSLEIDWRHQKKGWGSFFMNFAKKESLRQNCDGRLYLVAYNPFDSPHIFYKKQGLVAKDYRIDNLLNLDIKNQHLKNSYPATLMYLPSKASTQQVQIKKTNKKSLRKQLSNNFQNTLNLFKRTLDFFIFNC